MHTNNRSRWRWLTIPGLALAAAIATCAQAGTQSETNQDSANTLSALTGRPAGER